MNWPFATLSLTVPTLPFTLRWMRCLRFVTPAQCSHIQHSCTTACGLNMKLFPVIIWQWFSADILTVLWSVVDYNVGEEGSSAFPLYEHLLSPLLQTCLSQRLPFPLLQETGNEKLSCKINERCFCYWWFVISVPFSILSWLKILWNLYWMLKITWQEQGVCDIWIDATGQLIIHVVK